MATIDDFQKIAMQVGTIIVAEHIEGADKLLRLEVDFGTKLVIKEDGTEEEVRDVRQILSGIREYYTPEQLIGKQCPFVTNLEPRTMRGLVSHGMILAVKTADGGAVLLHPEKFAEPGSSLS
jgi:methionyl-tRNA synthetase